MEYYLRRKDTPDELQIAKTKIYYKKVIDELKGRTIKNNYDNVMLELEMFFYIISIINNHDVI